MATIVLSVVIALLVFAGMAVGLMFGRQPIKGSCGGMSAMSGGGSCSVCGDDPAKCPDTGTRASVPIQPQSVYPPSVVTDASPRLGGDGRSAVRDIDDRVRVHTEHDQHQRQRDHGRAVRERT